VVGPQHLEAADPEGETVSRIFDLTDAERLVAKHRRFIMSVTGEFLCDWCYGPSGEHEDDCIWALAFNGRRDTATEIRKLS